MELTKCPNCAHDVTVTAEKCPYCGHTLTPQKPEEKRNLIKCPNCGRDILAFSEHCPYCSFILRGINLKNLQKVNCPRCNAEVVSTSEKCFNCGFDLKSQGLGYKDSKVISITDFSDEYPFLAILCRILQTVGVINIIIAVIALIYGIVQYFNIEEETKSLAIGFIVGSIGYFIIFGIFLFAMVELIKVFIRVEFNTRK